MLGKVKLVRYKVVVLRTKKRIPRILTEDSRLCDEMWASETDGDVYFGHSYGTHYVGKHFDLWLTDDKADDIDNFVGFGRIYAILPNGRNLIYFTQNGKYLVEVMEDESTIGKGQGPQGGQRSQSTYTSYVPRAGRQGRVSGEGWANRRGHQVVATRTGNVASLYRGEELRSFANLESFKAM